MIQLSNGHTFSIACASGALAWGEGYWWEKYGLIPLGIVQPSLYTIICKTTTAYPCEGNMRWWPPCVMPLLDGGAVNAVKLTNRGFFWLSEEHHAGRFPIPGLKTIVSIMAEDEREAEFMAHDIGVWDHPDIVGIELNPMCPNVADRPMTDREKVAHICRLFRAAKARSRKVPVGIKLGLTRVKPFNFAKRGQKLIWPTDPFLEICEKLDGEADWFDLINTIKWSHLFPDTPSPLARWGYEGGYSGPKLIPYAREALALVVEQCKKTPILSGAGIGYTRTDQHGYAHEGIYRLQHRASAVTVGTPFLTRFWRVNRIARDIQKWEENRARRELHQRSEVAGELPGLDPQLALSSCSHGQTDEGTA